MADTTDVTDEPGQHCPPTGQPDGLRRPTSVGARPTRVPKLGVWSWCFVGFVVAVIIVVLALGAVSEIVLPMTFAAVLAVIFKPLVGDPPAPRVQAHAWPPALIVLGLLVLMVGVVVATVKGVDRPGRPDRRRDRRRRIEQGGRAARRGGRRSGRAGGRPERPPRRRRR